MKPRAPNKKEARLKAVCQPDPRDYIQPTICSYNSVNSMPSVQDLGGWRSR